MAHPALFSGGPKTPKEQEDVLETGIKLTVAIIVMIVVVALVQDWVKEQFSTFIDYTPKKAYSLPFVENDTTENE